MPGKEPANYDVDEVCLFLMAIGLDAKIPKFRENAIDGGMLLALEDGDYAELDVTSLQMKKIRREIEFCTNLAKEEGGGGGGGADAAKLQELQAENEKLKAQNAELKSVLEAMQKPPEPPQKSAPPPAARAPPPPRREHHVVRGAAGGAARGAALGAVAGAISGDPAQGAKMGAAMGT